MPSIALSQEFLKHFNISSYSQANPGGQKTVFFVVIEGLTYALKIINFADERLVREIDIVNKYSVNNGIPKIVRVDTYGKETIILEEFIDGDDLSDIYPTYHRDEIKICNLLIKISLILKPLWVDGYIHRDLKPQNIRIRKNGDPVILDFGIARALNEDSLTATGTQPLSAYFASPEQYEGNKKLISYRTDFFCLGIVAFYLYNNSLPFGNTRAEIDDTFQNDRLQVNFGSPILMNFCNAVLKRNPSERPRHTETFLKLLGA
jgi:serine/threonine protein kinase